MSKRLTKDIVTARIYAYDEAINSLTTYETDTTFETRETATPEGLLMMDECKKLAKVLDKQCDRWLKTVDPRLL